MTHTWGEKKQARETTCENDQMLDLTEKISKEPLQKYVQRINEIIIKEIKEDMITMLHQTGNINGDKL